MVVARRAARGPRRPPLPRFRRGSPGLIGARLVLGAGEGIGLHRRARPGSSTWLRRAVEGGSSASTASRSGAGSASGRRSASWLYHASGFHLVWAFAAAAPVLGALVALAHPGPVQAVAARAPGGPLIARESVRPGFALSLASVGYAAMASFIVLDLQAHGNSHGAIAFTVFAATVVLTRLLAGDLPDRVGPLRCAAGAAAVEALGLVPDRAADEPARWRSSASAAMGTAFSLLYPSLSLVVVNRVPEARRGAALGTFTGFFDLGVGLGAPLAGIAAALGGYSAAFWLGAALRARHPRASRWRSEEPGLPPRRWAEAPAAAAARRGLWRKPRLGPSPRAPRAHHRRQALGLGVRACTRPARTAPRSAGAGPGGARAASRTRCRGPRRAGAAPTPPIESAPASPTKLEQRLDLSGESLTPGISGAIRTPVRIPARFSSATASIRFRGCGVCGSVARQAFSSRVGIDRLAVNSVRSAISRHQLEVAEQQRRLGQHRAGVGEVAHRLPDALASACSGPRPTGRGPCSSRAPRARPSMTAAASSARTQLGHVDLDDDLALEVLAGVEVEVGMRGAGEAVMADHAVGDEVAGAGGDVEEIHLAKLALSPQHLGGHCS